MMSPLQMLALALATLFVALVGTRLQRGDVGLASGLTGGMLLLLSVIFRPSAFADYWPHVWIVDGLHGVEVSQLIGPEMVSRSLLAVLGRVSRNSEAAVDAMATLLLTCSLLGFGLLARKWAATPSNLAVVVGLFGPLLAFVLLRASFAYLLVAFVILRGPRFDALAAGAMLLALGFHLSVLLVLPALALYAILRATVADNFRRFLFTWGAVAVLSLIAPFALAPLLGYGTEALSANPEISRAAEVSNYLNPEFLSRSLGHDLYLLGVVALGLLLAWTDRHSGDLRRRTLFLAFFAVFAFLQVSPVAAFRFSPYFLLPLLLEADFPKALAARFGDTPVAVALGLGSGVVFLVAFLGCLA
jgi:hypothetical protein